MENKTFSTPKSTLKLNLLSFYITENNKKITYKLHPI